MSMNQSDPAVTVRDAVTRLIADYSLQDYASQLNEVAPRAVVAAQRENKTHAQIVQAAKDALRHYIEGLEKNEIGKLGRMQLYELVETKRINGNEWLFYPNSVQLNPHVSWVEGTNEVHVKFDDQRPLPATLYYDVNLTFTRVGKNGRQPTVEERNEADKTIANWKKEMLNQLNLRKAVAEFLS